MRHPALHAVALALLVATAGCSGFASSPQVGDAAVTETIAESPTTEGDTTSESDADLAPGLSERGVFDAAALVDAHQERLSGESLTVESNRVERYENGTVRNESVQTLRIAANRTRYRVLVNTTLPSWVTGAGGEGELWADGTHVFSARETNGTMTHERRLGPDSEPSDPRDHLHGDPTNGDRLLVLFTAFENESVGRIYDGDATDPDRYRVTAGDLAHPDLLADGAEARNATLDARITSDAPNSAFVHEYTLEYQTEIDGETVWVIEHVRFSNIGGTTVERPDWYDGSANRTD